MKKYLSALTALALLSVSCGKEEETPSTPGTPETPTTVAVTSVTLAPTTLTLEVGATGALTATVAPDNATVKTVTWASNNTAVATVSGGTVKAVAPGEATITATSTSNTAASASCSVKVLLSASSVTLDKTSIAFKALGETETLTATVLPEGTTDTIEWTSSNNDVATVADGVVTSVAAGTAEITAQCGSASATCSVTVEIAATSVSLDKTELTLEPDGTVALTATVLPANTTDALEWSSSDETVAIVSEGVVTAKAEGEAIITAKAGEQTATCKVTVKKSVPDGAVDLGLSVKWATCNIGASSPEEYGDYYAWGETETKECYDITTYKWCNGSYNTLTKYNTKSGYGTVDNKYELEPEDDVAHVKLGGNWRMPTDAEWTELRAQCTWTWTTQNGVNGRLVTASNGNSIFLPAAGRRDNTTLGSVGSWGYYRSSSRNAAYPYDAWGVYFRSDQVGRNYYGRFYGHSVRPVSE